MTDKFDPTLSEWQDTILKRLDDYDAEFRAFGAGQRAIIERQESHEAETRRLAGSLDEISSTVHFVKHEMANNTQVTEGAAKNARSALAVSNETHELVARLDAKMDTFSALNSLAVAGGVLIKRLAPLGVMVSAIAGTFMLFFKK